jgi:hypothetical protein
MRRVASLALLVVLGAVASGARAEGPATPAKPADAAKASEADKSAAATPTSAAADATDASRGEPMRQYHEALLGRRLGGFQTLKLDDVRDRAAEGEDLAREGRTDEAIAKLVELVESPKFEPFAENEAGRAAIFGLGDALATAGAYDAARAYLRRLVTMKGAWEQSYAVYARRATKRLVEVALESGRLDDGVKDLEMVPSTAPEEIRGDVSYLTGRAKEAKGDADGAIAAYITVPQTSRFWAQSTYLAGLLHVEKGRMKEGEDLFCKVADPKRADRSTPVFADSKFFEVRDLARLGLGRVAHEQFRFDDSRYYYYLVPRDSDHLAEALYEAATSRYEKKDYDGARELLDELKSLQVHHPYEDEAWILDAYVDLAMCKFPDADKKLQRFLELYSPVRDAARKISQEDRGLRGLAKVARQGGDAGNVETSVTTTPEAMRAIAALLRLDPAYRIVARRLQVIDHEEGGLRGAAGQIGDMQKALATTGGVRAAVEDKPTEEEQVERAQAAIDGLRRELDELVGAGASAAQIEPHKKELAALEDRLRAAKAARKAGAAAAEGEGKDLPDLLRKDAQTSTALLGKLDTSRKELEQAELVLAKDALHRVDLRLSRLLRRARLGRIESVLGKKRALEVEIEAIADGYLPQDAVDSLESARYLKDNEEYWPFEGDDWPDEFVGGEGL